MRNINYKISKIECYIFEKNFQEILENTNDEELSSFIQFGISSAKPYNIETEINVARYITLMTKHGKEFDKQPWAKQIIESNKEDIELLIWKLVKNQKN